MADRRPDRRSAQPWPADVRRCRADAAAVRRAALGRDVIALMRPRGITGLLRSRLPLASQLYLASLQGRVVRSPGGGLLMLEPPGQFREGLGAGGRRGRWVDLLDRYWDVVVFAAIPGVILSTAAALALLAGPGGRGFAVSALVLAVLGMLSVLCLLVSAVFTAVLRAWRDVERTPDPAALSGGVLLSQHWCVSLCHVPNAEETATILRQARERIGLLSRDLPTPRRLPAAQEVILCQRNGFTTVEAQRVVLDSPHTAVLTGTRPQLLALGDLRIITPRAPRPHSANGIFFILGGSLVVLLLLPFAITQIGWPTCAAGAACPAEPDIGYLQVLTWLTGRLFLDASVPAPPIEGIRVFGWLTTVLGLTLLSCVAVAIHRQVKYAEAGVEDMLQDIEGLKQAHLPTFGIVTALPEEFVAMRALLRQPIDYPIDGDRTTYVLGKLPSHTSGEEHPLVLTLMQEAGIDLAAAACTNLSRSFPSVNCIIMVGIAAGVPNPGRPEQHVRLGDIVVANWGVIGFDHVDQRVEGVFLRNGIPQPSTLLKGAVNRLRAREITGQRPWEQWLDVTDRPELHSYLRPPEDTDVLTASDGSGSLLPHPDPSVSGHQAANPKVHYGLIGSSERSLRDPRVRDELAAIHNLRALEMEGKGIANSSALNGLEWMMVRGVSDYGDSRTNGTWRHYASLTAAAYVRALLAECAPLEPRGGHPRGMRAGR